MNIRGTSVRKFVCFATVVLGLILFSPMRSFGGDAPRPIASMTLQQRMNLPGDTRVKLHTGRIATLAVLREEHLRRMQRFANTAALARVAHSRMPAISPSSAKTGQQQTQRGGKHTVGAGPTSPSPSPGRYALALDANPRYSVAPNQFMANSKIPLPRDYVAACTGSTACLYLPALTYLASWTDLNTPLIVDIDPMIVDPGVCASDGGFMDPNGDCGFAYPMKVSENFKLARKQSTTGRCDPPMKFSHDPADVIKLWYDAPDNSPNFLVLQDALTCAIQVWQAP
jgi:hypothetical protein